MLIPGPPDFAAAAAAAAFFAFCFSANSLLNCRLLSAASALAFFAAASRSAFSLSAAALAFATRLKTSLPFAVPFAEELLGTRLPDVVARDARGLVRSAIAVEGRGRTDEENVVGLEVDAERGFVLSLDTTRTFAGADGRVVATLFARLWAVEAVVEVETFRSFPFMTDSLALLAFVCLTTGALLMVDGAGRALNTGFLASSASFCCRASRAAFSFAATASPGSWKVLCVSALVDLGGGGGVGKDIETGRGLLCGITTSFFSPFASSSDFVLLVEMTRFPPDVDLMAELSRTLLALPNAIEGRGLPREGTLGVASLL